jgi:hypothetical protein
MLLPKITKIDESLHATLARMTIAQIERKRQGKTHALLKLCCAIRRRKKDVNAVHIVSHLSFFRVNHDTKFIYNFQMWSRPYQTPVGKTFRIALPSTG